MIVPMRPEEVKKSCWVVRVVVVVLATRGTETESLDDMEPIYPFIERTNGQATSVSNRSGILVETDEGRILLPVINLFTTSPRFQKPSRSRVVLVSPRSTE